MESIYCVKCRQKQNVETTEGPICWTCKKTGVQKQRNGIHGTCPKCGTKMKKFIKAKPQVKEETPKKEEVIQGEELH